MNKKLNVLKVTFSLLSIVLINALPPNAHASYSASFEKMSEFNALEAESNTETGSNFDDMIDPNEQEDENNDPLEGFNRVMFAFNELFDTLLLRPLSVVYDTITPTPIKNGVGNVLNNLAEPVTFINDLLQLKFDRAGETFARFAVNTTFGLGGMFNVANDWADLNRHKEDFGQTLGTAGIESGPYLVLPFIGPSNFRDMIGTAVDVITDPADYGFRRFDKDNLVYVRKGADLIHRRARALSLTDSIDKTAPDKYVRYRTLYNQYRHSKIKDGEASLSAEDSVEMVE